MYNVLEDDGSVPRKDEILMRLSKIFADGLIIQANKPIHIFGVGCGTATAEIAGSKGTTTTDIEKWCITLPPHDYGGPYTLTVCMNDHTVQITDVWFGDVYMISGQSNIQFKMLNTNTPREYYKANESLRMYSVDLLVDYGKHVMTDNGWMSLDGDGNLVPVRGEHFFSKDGWVPAREDEIQFWSAIGYLVGNELQERTGRKIGLVNCYQSGSAIQTWIPRNLLTNEDRFKYSDSRANQNGVLYEEMVETITPFSFNSVIWYQGEHNSICEQPDHYSRLLKLMITSWSKSFLDSKLPFIVIQLPDCIERLESDGGRWRRVQTAQEEVCSELDQAYLVVSRDVCENDDMHPLTKLPLAMRIAKSIQDNILNK